jgi:hypothetical protein
MGSRLLVSPSAERYRQLLVDVAVVVFVFVLLLCDALFNYCSPCLLGLKRPANLGAFICCRGIPPCRISIRSTATKWSRGHVIVPSTPDNRDRRPMLHLGLAPAPHRRRLVSPALPQAFCRPRPWRRGRRCLRRFQSVRHVPNPPRFRPIRTHLHQWSCRPINPHPRGGDTMMDTTM